MTTFAPLACPTSIVPSIAAATRRIESIDLATLDRHAELRTRKDRKYVVSTDALLTLLAALPEDVRALEIDGRRWFGYLSVYFDTDRFDSYRLAAAHRPRRFKVRTRTYLDSDLMVAEVKTKNRRGRTVKHRRRLDGTSADGERPVREFATEFAETAPYASALEPVLASRYHRATLTLPADGVRVTVDAAYRCTDADGRSTGLGDRFIIETKTDGTPSVADRLLWRAGHRPEKVSKYATGLAALHPELPANRWHPVLSAHFDRSAAGDHGATRHPQTSRPRGDD
ncbi:MAG: polyphosphate polymerase domain-containing protein [Actinomycetota bacterium]